MSLKNKLDLNSKPNTYIGTYRLGALILKLKKHTPTTHVTVFSADVIGSTSLIQDMEPQEVANLLDPILDAMSTAVHTFGGMVIRADGDGIMAVFGTKGGQKKDNAIHAVKAGQNTIKNVQEINSSISLEKGINIRIGLHSGNVLMRQEDSDFGGRYNLVGNTIHICSKVENSGNPNVITISSDTHELVGNAFKSHKLQEKIGRFSLYEVHGQNASELTNLTKPNSLKHLM